MSTDDDPQWLRDLRAKYATPPPPPQAGSYGAELDAARARCARLGLSTVVPERPPKVGARPVYERGQVVRWQGGRPQTAAEYLNALCDAEERRQRASGVEISTPPAPPPPRREDTPAPRYGARRDGHRKVYPRGGGQ